MQTWRLVLTFSPLYRPVPAALGSPLRRPISTSWPPTHGALKRLQRRPPSPIAITMIHRFSYGHIKRWRCIRCRLRQWSQIMSAHAGDFQCRISGRNLSFLSSLGLHSFEFRRVLTAARQQWTLDSDSELDFDGFVTVEFGKNGRFAANLAPETMWINFFFLTGMSDVNSDSSDADSASVAMSLTATILWHSDVG